MDNLFDNIPSDLPEELIQAMVETEAVRVERIISKGHCSPPGFWYDQPQDEWVVLLQGSARLRFENQDQPVELRPGDHLRIPARTRHRVDWTPPDEATIWLAVHFDANA